MKLLLLQWIAAILLLSPPLIQTSNPALPKSTDTTAAIQFNPIAFVSNTGESVDAEMGWLTVPENRARPQGNKIKLPVVRFKTSASNPGDPIIYLAGGPGASGLESAKALIFPALMAMREQSDVIVFDSSECVR